MNISEVRGAEAVDLLADLVGPIGEIATDAEIGELRKKENIPVFRFVGIAIKKHKEAVIEILAALNGVPAEDYHENVFGIVKQLTALLSNEEIQSFFGLSEQKEEKTSSGSATENIAGKEK